LFAEEMQFRLAGLKKFSGPLFAVEGVIWAGVILSGGGILLIWPALASFASAAALIRFPANNYTSALIRATSLYGIVVGLYQVYVASTILSGGFTTFATISIALFSVVIVLYVVLLFLTRKE
jgi:hypothetical protein